MHIKTDVFYIIEISNSVLIDNTGCGIRSEIINIYNSFIKHIQSLGYRINAVRVSYLLNLPLITILSIFSLVLCVNKYQICIKVTIQLFQSSTRFKSRKRDLQPFYRIVARCLIATKYNIMSC
jgi:hypothetical protein